MVLGEMQRHIHIQSMCVYYVNRLDQMKHALNFNDIGNFTCYSTFYHEMRIMLCKREECSQNAETFMALWAQYFSQKHTQM